MTTQSLSSTILTITASYSKPSSAYTHRQGMPGFHLASFGLSSVIPLVLVDKIVAFFLAGFVANFSFFEENVAVINIIEVNFLLDNFVKRYAGIFYDKFSNKGNFKKNIMSI